MNAFHCQNDYDKVLLMILCTVMNLNQGAHFHLLLLLLEPLIFCILMIYHFQKLNNMFFPLEKTRSNVPFCVRVNIEIRGGSQCGIEEKLAEVFVTGEDFETFQKEMWKLCQPHIRVIGQNHQVVQF